jgi:hypothetical protein
MLIHVPAVILLVILIMIIVAAVIIGVVMLLLRAGGGGLEGIAGMIGIIRDRASQKIDDTKKSKADVPDEDEPKPQDYRIPETADIPDLTQTDDKDPQTDTSIPESEVKNIESD